MHDVVGWRCAVCATTVDLTEPFPWRCPRSTLADRRHLLEAITLPETMSTREPDAVLDLSHPFRASDHRLAWSAAAAARGMTRAARNALVDELDDALRRTGGAGFEVTPFARSSVLSDELGFSDGGGVWVKDETGNVAGSQKARHLATILLHLRALEERGELGERPRLAIASCGNAALAAATLADAAGWPIDVYVPTWMSDGFGAVLDELGAVTHRCERRADDGPGDPAMLRFREAVDRGAVPFTVQGPENALCLDGGRTIGWEIAEQATSGLDRVYVQVGGGAFATCLGRGLLDDGVGAAIMAVQTQGCAPFERAARRAAGMDHPERHWEAVMTPWDDPSSLADGIIDDETYDWIGVLDVVGTSGGAPVLCSEADVARAHELAVGAGFDVSPTGSAGLAGLLADSGVRPDDRVAVVMSGVSR